MNNAARPQNITLGIALIIAAALTISVQDVVFKMFRGDLTLWQIFALRGLMALPVLMIIGALRGAFKQTVLASITVWSLLRGFCLTMTFLAFYAAIPFLSLSTVGAANYIAPIFVALLSAYVIGEAVGRLGWIGVCLGFIGVVVLLRPGSDAFSVFALLPIGGAAFYAVGHIITRTKCQSVPVAALTLSLNIMMMLAGLIISAILLLLQPTGPTVDAYPFLFGAWTAVGMNEWLLLIALVGFTVSIGMMLAAAYKMAPPATIATFEYSYLVFVAVWDILFFDLTPTPFSLAGMAMIVLAGILVMRGRKA